MGFRACTASESHYHSYIGEVAVFCWAVGMCKRYLWGCMFYALCDMKTLYRILEYNESIHVLRRWSQERFGYNFATFHRSHLLMKDVNALN